MSTECPSYLRGKVMRATRLNGCGQSQYGDGNMVVSDGFISVKMSAEVEEGEEVSVTKANGKTCISDKPCDQLKWYTVESQFCQVDPALVTLMNPTWQPVHDNQGDVVGFDAIGELSCDTGFALELWMDVYGETDACTGQEAQGAWGYMLLPWVVGGAPGDLEINNGAVTFTFTGRTKIGNRWRRGPYNVTLGENNVPSPLLTPVPQKAHYRLFTTTVRPPEPECGAQPVERPTPDPAELVITGLPNEDPRRTVRMFVNNHGFGPVMIDWGDGTPAQQSIEGRWVTHAYGSDGPKTITVSDKQTPAVKTSRQVQVPLPSDEPVVELSCGQDPSKPLQVHAEITMPPQSDGTGTVDWGDGSEAQEFNASKSGGTVSLAHAYAAPSIYTVSVRRGDQDRFRGRDAIQVPCTGEGQAPKVCAAADPADPTGRTVLLTVGKDCDETPGGQGPQVTVARDSADPSGRTAVVTVDNTSQG